MEQIDGIVRISANELQAIIDNGKYRSREEIDSVYKLMDIIKDAHCIWKYEDEESEYSEEGRSYDGSYRTRRGNYEGSYARGRKRYADGRFAPYSRRGYSNDGREEYVEHLRGLMDGAPDEQTRQSMQRMISQLEQR